MPMEPQPIYTFYEEYTRLKVDCLADFRVWSAGERLLAASAGRQRGGGCVCVCVRRHFWYQVSLKAPPPTSRPERRLRWRL